MPIYKNLNNKILGIELLRFITAFAIVVFHYKHFFLNEMVNFRKESQPFYYFLNYFYNYGSKGVDIFWSISGFIFFYKYRNLINDNLISLKNFFFRRFSRLYPLHFFTLVLVVILQTLFLSHNNSFFIYENNNLKHFFLQIFFASNWGFEDGFSFNGPIWSVSIEILVYFIFFLILKYISKSFFINVLILTIFLLAKLLGLNILLLKCLAYFYLGGLSAIVLKFSESLKKEKYLIYFALLGLLLSIFVCYYLKIFYYYYFEKVILFIIMPIILIIFSTNSLFLLKFKKVFQLLGSLTYAMYLIHFPVQLMIVNFYDHLNIYMPYESIYFFLTYIFFTLISSYYLYYYFESPIKSKIRDFFIR